MPELELQDNINMMLVKIVYLKGKTTIGTKFLFKRQGKYWLMSKKKFGVKK